MALHFAKDVLGFMGESGAGRAIGELFAELCSRVGQKRFVFQQWLADWERKFFSRTSSSSSATNPGSR